MNQGGRRSQAPTSNLNQHITCKQIVKRLFNIDPFEAQKHTLLINSICNKIFRMGTSSN
jgi:hypothetical protein